MCFRHLFSLLLYDSFIFSPFSHRHIKHNTIQINYWHELRGNEREREMGLIEESSGKKGIWVDSKPKSFIHPSSISFAAGEKDQYCEVSNVSVFVFSIINRNESPICLRKAREGRVMASIFVSSSVIVNNNYSRAWGESIDGVLSWAVGRECGGEFFSAHFHLAVARKMMMMMKKARREMRCDVHNACALVVKFQFSQGCELWRFINLTRMSIQGVNENV